MYVFDFKNEEAGLGESLHINRESLVLMEMIAESVLHLAARGGLVERLMNSCGGIGRAAIDA
jgi:hypothetical protein